MHNMTAMMQASSVSLRKLSMLMNGRSLRVLPSSLVVRMALILAAGLLAAQLASTWLQWSERMTVASQMRGQRFADHIAQTVHVLEGTDSSQRSTVVSDFQSDHLRVELITENPTPRNPPHGQIKSAITALLGSEREIRVAGVGGRETLYGGPGGLRRDTPARAFDVRLNDGQWVRISMVPEPDLPTMSRTLIAQLLIVFIAVISVVMMAARLATKPLDQLARAADALGHNLDAPPLSEEGLVETRLAAQAFNHMQARIKHLANERTQALVAISHDLRTPLTRLRLRSEFVDDDQLRDQLVADLDAMSALIDQALEYFRGLQDSEEMRPIDMNALLQSLAEDAAATGRPICIVGLALTPYTGRLSVLRRALQNLIDDAVEYGCGAHIRVEDDAAMLRLIVEHDGPALPPAEPSRAIAPVRGKDASRRMEVGIVGLGVSIVKDVALMHDGDLLIIHRPDGGFSSVLVLPRTTDGALKGLDRLPQQSMKQ